MAGEDDDIAVTIETEVEDSGNTTVVLDDQTQQTRRKTAPDDPVETLRAQLAEKTTELQATKQKLTATESTTAQLNQRVQTAERVATEAQTQVANSTKSTIESGIAAAKAEADAAEEAYKVAFEAGNAAEAAKSQRRLARAEADIAMLEQAKEELPAAPVRQQQQPTQQADPTETFISQHTQRTQQWLRAHMDYVTDGKKNAKMVAGHWDAVGDGLTPDTDAYFDHVEKFVGLKKSDPQPADAGKTNGAGNGAATTQQTTQRRPSAPVAPVTPSGGGVSGGTRTVTLTKGEADAATDGVTHVWNYDDPTGKNRFKKGEAIGIKEMARRKEALMKAGRYMNANIDGT